MFTVIVSSTEKIIDCPEHKSNALRIVVFAVFFESSVCASLLCLLRAKGVFLGFRTSKSCGGGCGVFVFLGPVRRVVLGTAHGKQQ